MPAHSISPVRHGSNRRVIAVSMAMGLLLFSAGGAPHDSASVDAALVARHANRPLAAKTAVDPSINLRALWDGRRSVDFRAADFPTVVPAAKARFLLDDEYVLGLTMNGESRAYPIRFLAWHHIINDSVGRADRGGKAFVTVTY